MSDAFTSHVEVYTAADGVSDASLVAMLDAHRRLHHDVPDLMGFAARLSAPTTNGARTILLLFVARSSVALQRALRDERVADLRRDVSAHTVDVAGGQFGLDPEHDWWRPDVRDIWTDFDTVVAPGHTTLVVIDIQNDFCAPDGKRSEGLSTMFADVKQSLLSLIDAAREAGVPVVYTQSQTDEAHDHGPVRARRRRTSLGDGYLVPGTWGWELCDFISPRPDEEIVRKWRHSAFSNPMMDAALRDAGTKSVVVTGVATNGCVEGFARDAFARGYYTTVVEDAVATFDDELQAHSLRNMHLHFAALTTAAAVRRAWGDAVPPRA